MSRTKLLFLIGDYGTGGKERQLTEIIRSLPKTKYQINLFMKCSTSYYFDTIIDHLNSWHSLHKSHFNLLDIFSFKRFVKTVNPDVLFSFSTTLSHYALVLKLLGGFHYRILNGSIRDAPVKLNFHHRVERVLYNFYNELITNSYAGLRSYRQENKRGRTVLYNGFDMNRIPILSKAKLRKRFRLNESFSVVMVARMDHEKDQETFIQAAKEVFNLDNRVKYYIVGDGPKMDQYRALAQSLMLNSHVTFLGEINEVENFLKAADISVLTSGSSHGEGIPNVLLESLACGTPVIATDNGGTSEILMNNENGYLIKNGDYKELAKKILFLKNNPDILRSFSNNGVETIRNHFSIEKMISEFELIIP